jgi:hypothetical protein
MPNLITVLKYQPPYQKVETEQQLLEVFRELKESYFKFNQGFRIFMLNSSPVKDLEHFLRLAVRGQSVVLTGSGDIGGLAIQSASLEYNLSPVGALTRAWDVYRDGSCIGCSHSFYRNVGGDAELACKVMDPLWRQSLPVDVCDECPEYKALAKNSEGKPARKLNELILEAVK